MADTAPGVEAGPELLLALSFSRRSRLEDDPPPLVLDDPLVLPDLEVRSLDLAGSLESLEEKAPTLAGSPELRELRARSFALRSVSSRTLLLLEDLLSLLRRSSRALRLASRSSSSLDGIFVVWVREVWLKSYDTKMLFVALSSGLKTTSWTKSWHFIRLFFSHSL